jgi:hypothetical protein
MVKYKILFIILQVSCYSLVKSNSRIKCFQCLSSFIQALKSKDENNPQTTILSALSTEIHMARILFFIIPEMRLNINHHLSNHGSFTFLSINYISSAIKNQVLC